MIKRKAPEASEKGTCFGQKQNITSVDNAPFFSPHLLPGTVSCSDCFTRQFPGTRSARKGKVYGPGMVRKVEELDWKKEAPAGFPPRDGSSWGGLVVTS